MTRRAGQRIARHTVVTALLLSVGISAASEPPFRLPSVPAPLPLDRRADPPDARVGTYPDPQLHAPWLGPAIGLDARVTGDAGVAFAAEGIAAVPFQIWRGSFDPGFFPTLRGSWRGRGTLDGCIGLGFGVFEDKGSFDDGWKTLSYTPQVAWRLIGPGSVTRGFRHDLVFKPGLLHIGLAHSIWPGDGSAVHELRLVIGASILEDFL